MDGSISPGPSSCFPNDLGKQELGTRRGVGRSDRRPPMTVADLCTRAAAAYEALLQEGREEARSHLALLSNRQLEHDVIQTRRELAEIGED